MYTYNSPCRFLGDLVLLLFLWVGVFGDFGFFLLRPGVDGGVLLFFGERNGVPCVETLADLLFSSLLFSTSECFLFHPRPVIL
jgi:hypothetical protein